ncbi:hypothetical protein [Nocardioides gansuensis]|nr:hypothetical protein [Nocardioides gansuensis]
MANQSSFSLSYTGGIAVLLLGVALVGTLLTGERLPGTGGTLEVLGLVASAALLAAGALGGRLAGEAGWPAMAALAGIVLLVPAVFLRFASAERGSALIFEIAALAVALLFLIELRKVR